MGSNNVLKSIYSALLNVIEPQSANTWRCSAPEQALTAKRRLVKALASGDADRVTSLLASKAYRGNGLR